MDNEDRPLGVAGLEVSPGDHICALYRGEEGRDAIALGFLEAGISDGDRCVCIVDSASPDDYWGHLGADGGNGVREQVEILDSESTYLREDTFDPETMIDFWDGMARESLDDGYDFVRSVGEMTWALQGLSSLEPLLTYESRLNSFVPRYPQVNLCLYDLDAFDGALVVDMLKIHPQVLVAGAAIDNPFYTAPEALRDEQFDG